MLVGSRVVFPEDLGLWDADLVQVSVYRGMRDRMEVMRQCASLCRKMGLRYVVHPVQYSLSAGSKEMLDEVMEMARLADLALILHDERAPGGGRLKGRYEAKFREALRVLGGQARLSIENAADTADVFWFWEEFAESVTLDLGHVESSGLDSTAFVGSLGDGVLGKLDYVHIHRNGQWHGGITDHWELRPDCRELAALRALLKRKRELSVILEINETAMIEDNLKLLRRLREETAGSTGP
jgi:hypothetical protein